MSVTKCALVCQALYFSLLSIGMNQSYAGDGLQPVGKGFIRSTPKSAFVGQVEPNFPPFRTVEMLAKAAPTNQWYSSAMFNQPSQPIYAHPVSYKVGIDGMELSYPRQSEIKVDGRVDIAFSHNAALTVIPADFKLEGGKIAGTGDFSVNIEFAARNDQFMRATLVHGSPMSYYEISSGDLVIRLAKDATLCEMKIDQQTLCVEADKRFYAVFAPPDANWQRDGDHISKVHFGAGGRFISVAALPDGRAETLAEFKKHAYAFVTDTRVEWKYDQATSKVETVFTAQVKSRAGGQIIPLLGLYPHQARALIGVPIQSYQYESIRGPMKVIAQNSFKTAYTYHGILPYWGGLQTPDDKERLASVLTGDAAKAGTIFSRQQGSGTYWYGKGLNATVQLMNIAEVEGDKELSNKLLENLKERIQVWFNGEGAGYFVQNKKIGTVLGYPDEFGSVKAMNDHHFHYGYWVNAAAQIAMRDPQWALQDQWGGMVNLLISDIAYTTRGANNFPFIRNFDPYEGHSWASGDADFPDGNNQESSSEAVNAWAGLILWGEATGNRAVRDLGVWLYTTETESISDYWFDQHKIVFPPTYGKPVAAMVFGARYAYNTWWTQEPRQIQGINLLPITPASVYLGRDPIYIEGYFKNLPAEKRAYSARGMDDGTPEDIWQDVLVSFEALGNPDAALKNWKPKGSTESGETRSHTLFWMLSLKEMGTPDFSITANTALYEVFKTPAGKKTYMAYNPGSNTIDVQFSDGKKLHVEPRNLARE